MKNIVEIASGQFEEAVRRATVPVLVDFYAPWCAPCRMIAPALDKLAGEFAGRVKVVKVNVDEAPELAYRYGVRGVPTLMLFRNGEVEDTIVGLVPPRALEARLEEAAAANEQPSSAESLLGR